jgi:hypothetical protein
LFIIGASAVASEGINLDPVFKTFWVSKVISFVAGVFPLGFMQYTVYRWLERRRPKPASSGLPDGAASLSQQPTSLVVQQVMADGTFV